MAAKTIAEQQARAGLLQHGRAAAAPPPPPPEPAPARSRRPPERARASAGRRARRRSGGSSSSSSKPKSSGGGASRAPPDGGRGTSPVPPSSSLRPGVSRAPLRGGKRRSPPVPTRAARPNGSPAAAARRRTSAMAYLRMGRREMSLRTGRRGRGGSGRGGTRTPKLMRALDPEPSVSTNSTTRPGILPGQGTSGAPPPRASPASPAVAGKVAAHGGRSPSVTHPRHPRPARPRALRARPGHRPRGDGGRPPRPRPRRPATTWRSRSSRSSSGWRRGCAPRCGPPSRLDHPGIVALRDWGEDRECLYLVWELVEGPLAARGAARPTARPGDRGVVRVGEDVLARPRPRPRARRRAPRREAGQHPARPRRPRPPLGLRRRPALGREPG